MGVNKKGKRKLALLGAVLTILLLGYFLKSSNVTAGEREQYTSVSVEFRDADTGGIFYSYEHPWQRVGKKYTYYIEEKINQPGKGCYMYDETHEGTVSEIASLSQKEEENRVVLYYRFYDMGEEEYAVNVTYKDADTEEIIKEEVRKLGNSIMRGKWGYQGYYSIDMDYCIAGNDGKSYLYDTKNEKNIPIVRIDSNPERNRIVLYYREGTVQEGEAVAEVYYMCEDLGSWRTEEGYLAKSYVVGLSVGESYVCQDEEVLQAHIKYEYDPDGTTCRCFFDKKKSSLAVDFLSADSKDNIIEIQHTGRLLIGGVPSYARFSTVAVLYKEEDTGKTILEDAIEVSQHIKLVDEIKMFDYRPRQMFYGKDGRAYYFDNTKDGNVLQVNPRNNDIDVSKGKSFCRERITAYYRPVRTVGEAADVCVNYLDADTGKPLKTETLFGASVGSAYSHTPKKTFALNGRLYTFDKKNAGNYLALQTVSGHPDIDRADAHYTGKSLKKILKTPKIKKLFRKGKKSAKLKVGKIKGVSGYQAVYAYNKKFKSAKKVSSKKPDITLKNLKKGKVCYVKVRAYMKTDEGTVYGAFGKRKRLK